MYDVLLICRWMFPALKLRVSGLDPNANYLIMVNIMRFVTLHTCPSIGAHHKNLNEDRPILSATKM